MILFLIFLILPVLTVNLNLHTYLAEFGEIGQKHCVQILPTSAALNDWSLALICGVDLPKGEIKQAMTSSGLIHLVVASSSHLHFLVTAFSLPFFLAKKQRLSNIAIFLILISYAWLSGFQPPIVRGLIAYFLVALRYSFQNSQLLAILILLSLLPNWSTSLSLILSAIAGVSLGSFLRSDNPVKKQILQSLAIYLFLLPCLYGWANPHPTTIIFNLALNSFLGIVAIPLTLISCFLPWTRFIIDPVFLNFFDLLQNLSLHTSTSTNNNKQMHYYFWLLFSVIYCLQHMLFMQHKRQQ